MSGPPGAMPTAAGSTSFRVWAPRPAAIDLELLDAAGSVAGCIPLERDSDGFAQVTVDHAPPGTRYRYGLRTPEGETKRRPDPASRFQPLGVHGPSEVTLLPPAIDSAAGLPNRPLKEYVFYELHVGTFTPQGTFDGAIEQLDRLADLGITAVELMPVAQFPGGRNWGYDGVYPFAAQNTYGGPVGLRRLVEACHARGVSAVLDVVYNHLGPEGNYLGEFAPYFTDKYHTPWGQALNFDGPGNDAVRDYFFHNALYWLRNIGFDALRIDAVHGIFDMSAYPFLGELQAVVEAEAARTGRCLYLIAESDLNDVRVLRPRSQGGFGMAAQWNDDFHHALHTLLTSESTGYYADFGGTAADLATAMRDGFVYAGQYSKFRGRRHGNSSACFDPERFVVYSQTHDQVGNRPRGDRLAASLDLERLKLAAGTMLLSPSLPLLFMGEEYGETAPFAYFISHSDPDLVEAVRLGRAKDLGKEATPDPQAETTFEQARLNVDLRHEPAHEVLERIYKQLINLHRNMKAGSLEVWSAEDPPRITLRRGQHFAVFHYGGAPWADELSWPAGSWGKVIDSAEDLWLGPGSHLPVKITSSGRVKVEMAPWAFALFALE